MEDKEQIVITNVNGIRYVKKIINKKNSKIVRIESFIDGGCEAISEVEYDSDGKVINAINVNAGDAPW